MHHRTLTPPDPALRELAAIYLATEVLVTVDGKPLPAHTYWKGFKRATAVGLILEHAKP